jgi:hypothetical protein
VLTLSRMALHQSLADSLTLELSGGLSQSDANELTPLVMWWR